LSVKNTGIAKYTLDTKHLPALGRKAKARLAAVPDKGIDLSDIPATYGVAWKRPGSLIPEENKRPYE